MMEIDSTILAHIRNGNDTIPGIISAEWPGIPSYEREAKRGHIYARMRYLAKYGEVEKVGMQKLPDGTRVMKWRVVE